MAREAQGTIFKISPTGPPGNIKILASFGISTGGVFDTGYSPLSLVEANDGTLYFTNPVGVYQLDASGDVNTVYSFTYTTNPYIWTSGSNPTSIMQGIDGNFYVTLSITPGTDGVSTDGGLTGAIVQITPGGGFKVIHSLAADGSEGNNPTGPLVQDRAGNLYGVATYSNNNHNLNTAAGGAVFQVTTSGGYTLLHSFSGGADGRRPNPALFMGSDLNLYGTTLMGGNTTAANCIFQGTAYGCGTVYRVTPTGTLTTLHAFTGGIPTSIVVSQNPTVDGGGPSAPLVQTAGGYFYGGQTGGPNNAPAIFKISLNTAIPSPVQLAFQPAKINVGESTTLTWQVLNAFSATAQRCGASIVGNPPDAGDWTGAQPGSLVNGIYTGAATITPTAAGTYTFALTCGGKESGFAKLVVSGLQILTKSLPLATVDAQYQFPLQIAGGISPYAWAIGGALPKGLTFNQNSGVISGKPQQFGTYSLAFAVQDSSKDPQRANVALQLIVKSGLSLAPGLAKATQGKSYSYELKASGGLKPYKFSLTSGKLPVGLKLNATSGVISGTPEKFGSSTFSITVEDAEDPKASETQTYDAIVNPPPLEITSPDFLPNAAVGEKYSFSLSAQGGILPYTWEFSGPAGKYNELPEGLTLSPDGTLAGKPTQWTLSDYQYFVVKVTDSADPRVSKTRNLGMTVKSTLKVTNDSLPEGTVGVDLDVTLAATGGIPPYKWTASSNPPPDDIGLYLDGDQLEYRPIKAGKAIVTIEVYDSEKYGAFSKVDLPLTILPTPISTTTALTSSNAKPQAGQSITLSATVAASNGARPTGLVTFYNGSTPLGTASLDATGKATFKTSFSKAGTYTVKASYSGDTTYSGSVSKPLTETVN